MKIVFHIPRMNWYRVLSSVIDEALRRGHVVECWHNLGAKNLKENCPNSQNVPSFSSGVPVIVDYEKPEEIIQLIEQRSPEMIVDLYPPRYPEISQIKKCRSGLPFWLIVDLPPSDSFLEIQSDSELYGCDAFAMCNQDYLEAVIRYGRQSKRALLSTLRAQASRIGVGPGEFVGERFLYQYGERQEQYIRERSIIVGNASFDKYSNIDQNDVRGRYAIPGDKKVIILLPFPFIYDQSAPWSQIFNNGSLPRRLYWLIKQKRFDYFWRSLSWPSNERVLIALRTFADNNNAILISKLRHSTSPGSELRRYCHVLVGEEGYYPHTAAELFSIANLVVGFYSTASTEAIALGVPYMNIDVPEFPKKFYCDTRKPLFNCDQLSGVVWSLNAMDAIRELPHMSLSSFKINSSMREKYLMKFANWPLGGASEKILNFIENVSSSI